MAEAAQATNPAGFFKNLFQTYTADSFFDVFNGVVTDTATNKADISNLKTDVTGLKVEVDNFVSCENMCQIQVQDELNKCKGLPSPVFELCSEDALTIKSNCLLACQLSEPVVNQCDPDADGKIVASELSDYRVKHQQKGLFAAQMISSIESLSSSIDDDPDAIDTQEELDLLNLVHANINIPPCSLSPSPIDG